MRLEQYGFQAVQRGNNAAEHEHKLGYGEHLITQLGRNGKIKIE